MVNYFCEKSLIISLMVRLNSCWITLAFILIASSLSFSQPSGRAIVNQPLEWTSLTNNFKLSNRLTLMAEGQFRFISNDPQQFQFRTALEVSLNKHFSV